MEVLQVALCEDDAAESQKLLDMLRHSPYPTEVTRFPSGETFLAAFHPFQYDLIFMDVFMEGMTGIEAIRAIRQKDEEVDVAFVTSSMDFALESYRLGALKYIEKPAQRQDVEQALQLAYLKHQQVEGLAIRVGATTTAYPLKRILYLEQQGRNLLIHMTGDQVVSVMKKLTEVTDQLEGKDFFLCHKSYMVNLAFVKAIDQELSLFQMTQGGNVHIRRGSFGTGKKIFADYLYRKTRGDVHE